MIDFNEDGFAKISAITISKINDEFMKVIAIAVS